MNVSPLTWRSLATGAGAAALLAGGAAFLILEFRGWLPSLSPLGPVAGIIIGVIVLIAGRGVRRLRAHQPTRMTPLGAATTALAARASALAGAITAGMYVGVAVVSLLAFRTAATLSTAWVALACSGMCAVWCGVGVLVEHWCRLPEDDDDESKHGSLSPTRGHELGATRSSASDSCHTHMR